MSFLRPAAWADGDHQANDGPTFVSTGPDWPKEWLGRATTPTRRQTRAKVAPSRCWRPEFVMPDKVLNQQV
jgi:hypothetical protein